MNKPQIIQLDKLALVELKAMVYDENLKIEMAQRNLQELNKAIINKQNEKNIEAKEVATDTPGGSESPKEGVLQKKQGKDNSKTSGVQPKV